MPGRQMSVNQDSILVAATRLRQACEGVDGTEHLLALTSILLALEARSTELSAAGVAAKRHSDAVFLAQDIDEMEASNNHLRAIIRETHELTQKTSDTLNELVRETLARAALGVTDDS